MNMHEIKLETQGRPPHHQPVAWRQPFGANRFIVLSPKAGRRVVLFGIPQFHLWLDLEADPTWTSICERPLILSDGKRLKPVDFWVTGPGGSKYVVFAPSGGKASERHQQFLAAFRSWAAEVGCDVEEIELLPASQEQEQWYSNWTLVLQHIAGFKSYVTDQVLSAVRDQVTAPISLGSLAQKLPKENPDHVRAAAFVLIHQGVLRFQNIRRERLSDISEVDRT